MIYQYDEKISLITKKLDTVPTDETIPYGIYPMELDLENYDNYIGSIDESHNITWMNPPKPKPAEILISKIKSLQAENDILGQTTAQLQLDNMQLNSTIDTLGAALAQAQLDIINLKGGAA